MAAISQENVNQLAQHISVANQNVGSRVTSGVSDFSSNTKEIWESNSAVKFASALNEAITSIVNAYKNNIAELVSRLKTNVDNHNRFNQGSVVVPAISELTYSVSALESIQVKFADGFEGLREGHTASEVMQIFQNMRSSIEEELKSAESSVASSNAFDESSEQQAVAAAFRNIFNILNQEMEELYAELGKALSSVDENATNLTSTNIGNIS